jgi:hypothetical protein
MQTIRNTNLARLAASTAISIAMLGSLACATGTQSTGTAVQPIITGRAPDRIWPVKTRENVDLWLHGFALLSSDSSKVPLFRAGYRDEMIVLKNKAGIITQLDANHDKLARQLATSRLLVNAQFIPFYFSSLDEMHSVIDHFIETDGNQSAAKSQMESAQFAVLNAYFQSGADRAWLALFASSLWDEDTRFFHAYWLQQQRDRAATIDSVTSLWTHLVRPRLTRYLANTQQKDGDIILSLPLGGEGRTLSGVAGLRQSVGVTFPARPADAAEAMYVAAHELVGVIANAVIADNTSPADVRSGVAAGYASPAAVRGGLMLLEKFVPELADGYARYYITATGTTPGAEPRTQLAELFPLPVAIRDAIAQQIKTIDSGI